VKNQTEIITPSDETPTSIEALPLQPRTPTMPIPEHVVSAYVTRFPHLRYLGRNAIGGSRQAILAFARVACRLEAPATVTPREVFDLAGQAEPPTAERTP
jgi:hypothetical protein